ncbi:MAG: phosphoenolpyruvate--protein phosphotransferase, partial [Candidatus Cloacimonetes bacterium]|nr:phosphoenolpyruvate--protein phosphotransferase [Candidatus Cloacimonadota bacterium]
VYIDQRGLDVPQHKILPEETKEEETVYIQACAKAAAEIKEHLGAHSLNKNEMEILSSHLDILADPDIRKNIQNKILKEYKNAALAIQEAFSEAIEFFSSMQNEMFAQRAADFRDVRNRLLLKILKLESDPFAKLGPETIPIFHEIHPSEVSLLNKMGVRAYVCEVGSITSHSAILSRALSIACVGAIPDLREHIHEGDHLIIDGELGLVVNDPDDEALEFYAQKMQILELISQKQRLLREDPAITLSGRNITMTLNIGIPAEIDQVNELNADGVGLFRTEFLFLSRNDLPSEDEQYEIYHSLATKIAPKILTIRTFDLGGDKLTHSIDSPKEENPYLGNRGIRFSLAHPEVLRTQLRAILRASVLGNIRIMFPMIIDVEDFLQAKRELKSCADELYEQGVKYDYDIQVGTMVEIPSAAISSESLARECDFLSLGTNDLVQYTLAVDRNNDTVSRYFIQHHPAVLKLIRLTIASANKYNRSISVCGEMASLKEYTPLLIGMGISELSVNPSSLYDIKRVVRNCDEHLDNLVKNFDFSKSLNDIDNLVYHTLKKYYAKKGADL